MTTEDAACLSSSNSWAPATTTAGDLDQSTEKPQFGDELWRRRCNLRFWLFPLLLLDARPTVDTIDLLTEPECVAYFADCPADAFRLCEVATIVEPPFWKIVHH